MLGGTVRAACVARRRVYGQSVTFGGCSRSVLSHSAHHCAGSGTRAACRRGPARLSYSSAPRALGRAPCSVMARGRPLFCTPRCVPFFAQWLCSVLCAPSRLPPLTCPPAHLRSVLAQAAQHAPPHYPHALSLPCFCAASGLILCTLLTLSYYPPNSFVLPRHSRKFAIRLARIRKISIFALGSRPRRNLNTIQLWQFLNR